METDCFADALSLYLDWHDSQRHSPRTRGAADIRVGAFLAWLRGRGVTRLEEVTPKVLLAYQGLLVRRLPSAWSSRTTMLTVKGFLNWCASAEGGFLDDSPAGKVKLPKAPKLAKPFLSEQQFRRVEELAKRDGGMLGNRRLCLIWLLCTTGLRAHEMAGIRLADIDRERRLIRVLGKGQKERQVPLHPTAHRMLALYLRHRDDKLPGLWITEERGPMTADGLVVDLRRLMDRAGVKARDRWHIWRRTWAANNVRQGVPAAYVQAVAGWEDGAMLSKYTAQMQREAEAIERVRQVDPWGAKQGPRG